MKANMNKCYRCQEKYNNALKFVVEKSSLSRWPFLCACIAEFFGTTILIIFGLGCSIQKTLGGYSDKGDFLSMSLNWGIGLSMGLFVSGVLGAGLMNPALTLAFAIIGKVPFIRVIPYTLCQFVGAWVGALLLLAVNNEQISNFVTKYDQGLRLMNDTGAMFVTRPTVSHGYSVMDQIFGTSLLAGLALTIGDKHNFNVPGSLQPLYIGLLLTGLQSSVAVNCGAALNPARDLGPRIALLMCGWGVDSFRDSDYYFWVPIVGPYVGALAGTIAYELLIGIHVQGVYTDWKKLNLDSDESSDDDDDESDSLKSSDDDDDDDDDHVLPQSRRSRKSTVPYNSRQSNPQPMSPKASFESNKRNISIDYNPE